MSVKTILFDLDNTLLQYPGSSHVVEQRIFESLGSFFSDKVSPEQFISAFKEAKRVMDKNEGSISPNEVLFNSIMCPLLKCEPYELAELSDRYYQEEYPKFRGLTRPMPGNRLVMDWAFSHNIQVAIATGYQMPISAIEERLEWANVPVSEYEYAMITTLRNMHTSKPHIGFYKEIIGYLGRAPEECLMIGDRMDDDILPATSAGIPSFWFTENGNESIEQVNLLVGMGDMEDLLTILNSIEVIELKA